MAFTRPTLFRPLGPTAVLILALVAGCGGGDDLPKTFPVRGKVVFKDGQPLTRGVVHFRTNDFPSLRTVGEVQPDGTFVVVTHANGRRSPGAVAGSHRVTVLPSSGADQSAPAVQLPKPFVVNETDDNQFQIAIDRPAGRR